MASETKELRATETEKLKKLLFDLKVRLVEYRFQLSQGSLKNTNLIKGTKRMIARILTILHERKESFSNRDLAHYMKLADAEERSKLARKNR
ncbi:50S ribosomal protein L29 [Candidatus Mycoplasma haematominutum]|uniref:Large ribosomal subunit protein uL29 n=1 Tax=Candidatus Mycoplasma haematominutum 'Birmingham 1' TaxID=1116213 RepID=G8C323_9MOLU|nr:50S ribosomal protein L29 [Candidatus Mycoplasma haematominutum]CCE66721.1 ribosomal protein L29 [Candidatus Mycoplasma haematominutum 'Birmingham 1']